MIMGKTLPVVCLAVWAFAAPQAIAQNLDESNLDPANRSYFHSQGGTLFVVRDEGRHKYLAYSSDVGQWSKFAFPEDVSATPIMGNGVCAFFCGGDRITQLVCVDVRGNWCQQELLKATQSCHPIVFNNCAVFVVDGRAYAFSAEIGKWDSIEAPVAPQFSDDTAFVVTADSIAVFSAKTGKWAVAQTKRKSADH